MYKYLITISMISLIALILVGGYGNLNYTQYSTYFSAKEAEIFAKGYLPEILPTSTIKIRVKNDFKEGSFKIPKPDLANFTNQIASSITFGGTLVYYYWDSENNVIWNFHISKNGYVVYDVNELYGDNEIVIDIETVNNTLNKDATYVAPIS